MILYNKGIVNEHLEAGDFDYIDRITLAIKYYVNYAAITSSFFCCIKSYFLKRLVTTSELFSHPNYILNFESDKLKY